jgi:F420-non-reducing hydrogenase iron-sulfur subunit
MSQFEPQIVGFCCSNCASAAAEVAEKMQLTLPENIRLSQLPCTGRLDSLHLLQALEAGADGVFVAGCQNDSCQFKSGIQKAEKKVKLVQSIMTDIGIEQERVALYHVGAGKAPYFIAAAEEMVAKIKELGPSPVKS